MTRTAGCAIILSVATIFLTIVKLTIVKERCAVKKNYMARLERWVRWMLPGQEGDDVIADYRDIVGSRPYEELLRDVGRPRDVAAPLAPRRAYRIWLAVFAALAACLLIPGVSPLPGMWMFWVYCFDLRFYEIQLGVVLAFLGMAGALVWFRWKGHKGTKLPRAVPILLIVLLVWIGAMLLVNWAWMQDPIAFAEMWGETPVYVLFGLVRIGPPGHTMPRSVSILYDVEMWGGFAAALAGLLGLVKARTEDRRWIAVYVLGMAAMVVPFSALAFLSNMELADPSSSNWWAPAFRTWVVYAGVGAVGAGIALC